ncbi:MAG: hypothetical protein ACD_38C00151G0007 [uncultured bacterium]|nr:MAG: hypothetical protein ACD_38C00151G0007 [uncultured bacterium]
MADPSVLEVQFLQVVSSLLVNAMPSGVEPVSISCLLGVSPLPFTTSPFSVKAVCLFILLASL